MHGKGLTSLEYNSYTRMPYIQATDLPLCCPMASWIYKPPSHHHGGVEYDTMYKWLWIGCHPFHMSCGCMGKVLKAWGVTYTHRCPTPRPQTTKAVGQDFAGELQTTKPFPGMCGLWLWYNVSVDMDGLPSFPHVLLVHGNDLTSLECYPYTRIPYIQVTDFPRYESRSGRIDKATKPSTWNF